MGDVEEREGKGWMGDGKGRVGWVIGKGKRRKDVGKERGGWVM